MSEEDRKLQKHLVDEMMKVSESNPDVMFYMEALMKYCIEIEQKVEQLENIRKEAKDFIKNKIEYYNGKRLADTKYEYIHIDIIDDLLNILNKGSEE